MSNSNKYHRRARYRQSEVVNFLAEAYNKMPDIDNLSLSELRVGAIEYARFVSGRAEQFAAKAEVAELLNHLGDRVAAGDMTDEEAFQSLQKSAAEWAASIDIYGVSRPIFALKAGVLASDLEWLAVITPTPVAGASTGAVVSAVLLIYQLLHKPGSLEAVRDELLENDIIYVCEGCQDDIIYHEVCLNCSTEGE